MEPPSLPQLESLKYSELQQVAKAAGLRANLKVRRWRPGRGECFRGNEPNRQFSSDLPLAGPTRQRLRTTSAWGCLPAHLG
uniref:Uncharacterized protein n=1 Tax=Terrapene triunguis TaxID=2587831 RepID=A0A674JIL5_9SAUR